MARMLLLAPLLSLLLATGGALPLAAQRPVTPCPGCDTTRGDENVRAVERELERIRADIERVRRNLAEQGRLDAETARALRVAESELRRSVIERQATVRTLAREQMATMQRDVSRTGVRMPMPRGWFGVVISSDLDYRDERSLRFISRDYPVIESVEPGSPADRAGLLSGDVLIALDRQDLREREIDFGTLLVPGAELPVRIRRNGRIRDVVVTVGARPAAYVFGVPGGTLLRTPVPRAPPRARTPVAEPRPAEAPVAPLAPLFVGAHGTLVLAGAQITPLKGDMREVFGVANGVLILDVLPATPAMRAGLRPGDVITAVDGEMIETPLELQAKALAKGEGEGEGTLALEIVRKRKRIRVLLEK